MERLNLRTPKIYDYEQEYNTQPPRIKFYCVSEGATEESYFKGIKNNKTELDIKNDVHIEIVEKEENQESYSHPMQLVDACLRYMGRYDEKGNPIPKKEWEKNKKWTDFEPGTDKACVIFDKDYRNLETRIEEIYSLCREHQIDIIMSNPNFELWLLMHYPNIQQYDREELLANRKNLRHQLFEDASENKKYLEIVLSRVSEGYTKGSKIDFEKYKPYINDAIAQANLYCTDKDKLFNELGTNVGCLIETMRM